MSHHKHKEETIICPNCGYAAVKNYCAQCGQETHLHKETFFGMIFHFVAHYFHYDSKFWQTLKMLITRPGKLTIEYWEKKRARHIPPISLYIFVSVVFFLLFFFLKLDHDTLLKGAEKTMNDREVQARIAEAGSEQQITSIMTSIDTNAVKKREDFEKDVFGSAEEMAEFLEGLFHSLPKMFFFLIPVMAFMLRLLFIRKKDTYFVDHSIFSLHIHALIFFLGIFIILPSGDIKILSPIINILQDILIIYPVIYMVMALRNVYNITIGKSILYTIVITIVYFIFFLVIFLTYVMYKTYKLNPAAFEG